MLTPLPVADALLVMAGGLFVLAVASGISLFVFHAALAVVLAAQLVGAAVKAQARS